MTEIIKSALFKDVLHILHTARQKAYTSINYFMIEAYWNIGKRIIEEEQQGKKRATYGEGIMKELSKALSSEFGKGFSVANLENFRKFYLTFPGNQKPDALRRELSWTHYRLIMRVENPQAREYYEKECAEILESIRRLI